MNTLNYKFSFLKGFVSILFILSLFLLLLEPSGLHGQVMQMSPSVYSNYTWDPVAMTWVNRTPNTTLKQNTLSNPGGMTSDPYQAWVIYDSNGNYNPSPNPMSTVLSPTTQGQITGTAQGQAQALTGQSGPSFTGDCGISAINNKWTYCMLTPIGGLLGSPASDTFGATEKVDVSGGLLPFFASMYKLGIGVAIGLAIVVIAFGGIRLATTDSISGTEEGRKMINAAFAGLFLALFSYVLLYTINPILVNNSTDVFSSKAPITAPK